MRTQTTAKMFVATLLVLIASTANSQLQDSVKPPLRCKQSTNCTCIEYNEVEIQCPRFEPHVFVRIQANNYVHFECEDMIGREYEMVPSYELDVAAFLQITKCSLIPGTSIMSSYLKNIKIDRIRSFQFVSSGANKNTRIESKHFKGLEGIERFDLRGMENEIRDLPSDLFVGMEKLSWIRIRVANIQLAADLFAPLKNLEFLELGHNKLQSLEPGFLRGQSRLQQLNLWGNSLKNLSKDTFVGLENVKELDLSSNGMESLEPDLFAHLTNLTDINLSSNNYVALPEGLFANNKKLNQVKLMENRVPMDTLPSDLFANLTELKEVMIKCDLRILSNDIFAGSTALEKIHLDQNYLDDLPEGLLRHQHILEYLDLTSNLISSLPDGIFLGAPSLRVLKLSRNRLTTISADVLRPLINLVSLYLNDNQISTIHSQAFLGIKNIEYITLQNNKINMQNQISLNGKIIDLTTGSPFQMLEKLRELNLGNNSLTNIFQDHTLQKLEKLNISSNKISHFSNDELSQLAQTTLVVDLSNNLIEEIQYLEISDQTPNVTVLLSNNPIECDCRLFNFIQHLHNKRSSDHGSTVDIKLDDVTCAGPGNMASKPIRSVKPMDLECALDSEMSAKRYCPVNCDCRHRPADKLLRISCDISDSIELPLASAFNLNETELRIENKNMSELIMQQTLGYKQVTKLNISYNTISRITADNLPPNLKVLDLSYNNLKTLNRSVIELLESVKLESLGLIGNTWTCDCPGRDFVTFAQALRDKVPDYYSIKCEDDRFLAIVNPADLCVEKTNLFVMIICIITAIMSLVLGVLAALYYKYQKQIKMWLYSHNMCMWFVTEEELDKDKRFDAFVSYSHRDQDFVADHLLPELENGTIQYKLCVHERDWSPGLEISTQISNSVNDAKRTIIVMSPNYLQSNWAQWEFRVAQSHAATEKRSRIIAILYGDIGDIDKLEPDIRDYLKLNTYVKWGDKWFWEKLKYAMPHVKSSERVEKSKGGLVKTAIKSSVDDKLELIKPTSVTPPQLTTPPAEKVANPLITSLNAKNANQNGKIHNNGYNGHINGAYVINTSSRQSDV